MKRILKSVIAPLVSLTIVMLGTGFFNTFVSLRISMEGYPSWVVGILNSAYYLGLLVGSVYMERLIQRVGHIRTFASIASINAFVILLQSQMISPYSWTLFRFFIGICSAGFFIVIESWLLLKSTMRTRGRMLSFYMLTLYMAQGAGQFLLNTMDLKNSLPFLLPVMLCSLSVIPVSTMKRAAPMIVETSITKIYHIFKKVPLGPIGCVISGMILSSFYGMGPIFAKESQMSIPQISQIMGFTILSGLALQWPIGYLSDLIGRRKVLIGVSLILIAICLGLYNSHHLSFNFTLILSILYGGFSFTLYPLSINYTSDYFSTKKVLSIICSCIIIYSTGCIIGPIIASLVMLATRPSGLFLFCAILSSLLALLSFLKITHGKGKGEEDQGEYFPLPKSTSLAYPLVPEADDEEEEEEEFEEDLFHQEEEDDDEYE